jgi:hypothetical protein
MSPARFSALALAVALAATGLTACAGGEHEATHSSAAAATNAAVAPAGVRTRSGHVFPGEGAQPQPRTHAASPAAGQSTGASAQTASTSTAGATSAAVAHTPNLGRYIGPPHNGASRCGYVAVGPGLEQASAFVVHGVSCTTARALAAARRHQRSGSLGYSALGFDCTASAAGAGKLQRFDCTAAGAAVSFVVA